MIKGIKEGKSYTLENVYEFIERRTKPSSQAADICMDNWKKFMSFDYSKETGRIKINKISGVIESYNIQEKDKNVNFGCLEYLFAKNMNIGVYAYVGKLNGEATFDKIYSKAQDLGFRGNFKIMYVPDYVDAEALDMTNRVYNCCVRYYSMISKTELVDNIHEIRKSAKVNLTLESLKKIENMLKSGELEGEIKYEDNLYLQCGASNLFHRTRM